MRTNQTVSRFATKRSNGEQSADEVFYAATAAVNSVLGRASALHGRSGCPERSARSPAGSPVVAYCDLGCFDDAVELVEDVVRRLRNVSNAWTSPSSVPQGSEAEGCCGEVSQAYARRAALAALGDLHRAQRKRLGLPQRPDRVTGAAWAERALPDPADRELLSHMLTWLGSAGPAVGDSGWPADAWSHRYGTTAALMSSRIERVVRALREVEPSRHHRYIAEPLAAKPGRATVFTDVEQLAGEPVLRRKYRYQAATPLWRPVENRPIRPARTTEEQECVA